MGHPLAARTITAAFLASRSVAHFGSSFLSSIRRRRLSAQLATMSRPRLPALDSTDDFPIVEEADDDFVALWHQHQGECSTDNAPPPEDESGCLDTSPVEEAKEASHRVAAWCELGGSPKRRRLTGKQVCPSSPSTNSTQSSPPSPSATASLPFTDGPASSVGGAEPLAASRPRWGRGGGLLPWPRRLEDSE